MDMSAFRPVVLIPTYNNPLTIRKVVEEVRKHCQQVLVVDDGSDEPAQGLIAELASDELARSVRRKNNGGKGAAVQTGLEEAERLGYTHALQVDADGQHTLQDIPRFLAAAEQNPDALILGEPVFDRTIPKSRLYGRAITTFWTRIETWGRTIRDPMCGFRVYPLTHAAHSGTQGRAMDFDPEIAVRLVWKGVPVIHEPTQVRYISKAQGGVSHFRIFADNVLISWMHTRLFVLSLFYGPRILIRRLANRIANPASR